jgi:hypothetical protein
MRINAKRLALAAALLTGVAVPLAWSAGLYGTLPIIGGAAYCGSAVVQGNSQGSITGQGGGQGTANTITGSVICGQTVPAGPPALTGTEVVAVDLNTPGTAASSPVNTAALPVTAIGNGYGTTVINTTTGTGQNPVVANGVSNYIYAGSSTATFATITLPPNPMQNQTFCIRNAGAGILTLTSIVVGTTGQVFVQGAAPTSIPVQVASGAQATVTNTSTCWIYNVSNTTWYRIT